MASWRDVVQRTLRSRGHLLARWPLDGSIERELQRILAALDVATVVDVGAHVGGYGRLVRSVGFDGEIISFEPEPAAFGALEAQLDDRWRALPLALGDEPGIAELHTYEAHDQLTSLRRPSSWGRAHLGMHVGSTSEVTVSTLDLVAEQLALVPSRTFVKVDTQGHDAAVLDGGRTFLAGVLGLQVEIPTVGLYEGVPTTTALVDRILDDGFRLVGLYPVHEHPRPLVPVEFDGLFVRVQDLGPTVA